MSSEDAAQRNDAPATDASPQGGSSGASGRRHFGRPGRPDHHRWRYPGGDAPSGWGFHDYGWGAPPGVELSVEDDGGEEEEVNEAEKEVPELTKEKKKQLEQQLSVTFCHSRMVDHDAIEHDCSTTFGKSESVS
jgi:hypothetical protein